MTNDHVTNEMLQMLLDGTLSPEHAAAVEAHLSSCASCANAYDDLRQLHRVMKRLPVEHAGGEFTRDILVRLNIIPRTSLLFRIVENLAYVFGLMIVLGVMLAVFTFTGVVGSDQIEPTQTVLRGAGDAVAQAVGNAVGGLTAWLQAYLPFVFGSGSLKIAVMGTLIAGMLALVDRFLKKRILH